MSSPSEKKGYKYTTILFLLILSVLQSCVEVEWSPQSASILFMSAKDGNAEIYLKQGMDSTWINLTNNKAGDNWASWSPDGKKILFQSTRSGNLDIWMMNKDGSDLIQLTDHTDHDYLPSFTPDGEKISFTSWRTESNEEEREPHIYIMNLDGTGERRLVLESLNTSAGASWHPEGQKFLFTRKTGEKGANIFEANKEGNILHQITDDTLYSGGAEYSPDGAHIIYTRDYGDRTEMILLNADGSDAQVLLGGEQIYYPHWSPDGSWVIFTKIMPDTDGKDLDIYAINLEDPENQKLLVRSPGREAEGIWK